MKWDTLARVVLPLKLFVALFNLQPRLLLLRRQQLATSLISPRELQFSKLNIRPAAWLGGVGQKRPRPEELLLLLPAKQHKNHITPP